MSPGWLEASCESITRLQPGENSLGLPVKKLRPWGRFTFLGALFALSTRNASVTPSSFTTYENVLPFGVKPPALASHFVSVTQLIFFVAKSRRPTFMYP